MPEDISSPQRAFVIGPIGDKDAVPGSAERKAYEEAIEVWEEVIVPACQAFGLSPVRADRIAKPGEIPDQVFRLLRDAEVVIADLTGANPNVMYELGLRHTRGRLTLQIGERERLPFDVSVIRTILFKRTEAGLIEARKRLSQALAIGLQDGGDPVTATRIWFETDLPVAPAVPEDVGDSAEEVGFLEKLAEMEEGMAAATPNLHHIAAITEEIGGAFQEGTAEVDAINKSGGGAGLRLQSANRLAARLEDPVSRLEVVVGDYAQSLGRIDPGMTYILERLISDPQELAAAGEFVVTIRKLIASAVGTLSESEAFRDTMKTSGEATRPLKRVTRRIAATLQRFIDSIDVLLRWRALLDQLPPDEELNPPPQP